VFIVLFLDIFNVVVYTKKIIKWDEREVKKSKYYIIKLSRHNMIACLWIDHKLNFNKVNFFLKKND